MSAAPGTGRPEPRKLNGAGSTFGSWETNGAGDGASGSGCPMVVWRRKARPSPHSLREDLVAQRRGRIDVVNCLDVRSHLYLGVVLRGRSQLEIAADDDAIGIGIEAQPIAGRLVALSVKE